MDHSFRYTARDFTAELPAAAYVARFRDAERVGGYCRECGNYGRSWGCPAVRVRYGGVRHALRHGAARRDQNHARGAGTPGLRSGTPDPARTAAARTSAAGDGTAIRRTLVRLRRNVHSLSRGELHAPRRQALPPSGTGAAVARSLRFDVARTASELFGIEMKWGSGGRMPEYLTLVCGFFHDAESVVWNRIRAVFNRNAAARIRLTRRCGRPGRAHTKSSRADDRRHRQGA